MSVTDPVRAWIADRRKALDELETAIDRAEHLFAPSLTVSQAAASRQNGETVARSSGRQKAIAARVQRIRARLDVPAAEKESGLDARVLAFLSKQTSPVTRKTVLDGTNLTVGRLDPVLERLIASRQIVRRGARRGLRLGTPSVMAAAIAASPEGD